MPELNDQRFYYRNWKGMLLGNKAREHLILQELESLGRKDFFLEVGCAQGHFEKAALNFSENVFAGDYAFEKLPKAKREFGKAEFLGINAEMLPFKSNSFDFVLCTEVLEHVPKWKKALKELQRVSRKRILLTVPLEKGYFWKVLSRFSSMDSRGHLHRLGSTELREGIGKKWRISRQEIVSTPSRRLNRLIGKHARERLGMYAMLVFERK